jgi:protein phosphatase
MQTSVSVAGLTHPGHVREINEDAMTWDMEIGFIAVADGMGGHNAGEIASALALDSVRSFLKKSAEADDFTWPFGVNPQLSVAANRLLTAIKIANRQVFRASEERAEYTGMGTTLLAAVVENGSVTFGSVGDSRIYLFDGTHLRQLTRDDSWMAMLAQESGLDQSALSTHPMRNVLTNVIGAQPEVNVHLDELALGASTLLFCTDGLHGAVSDEAMLQIVKGERDLHKAAAELIHAALEDGGRDNVTAVLMRAN